MLGKLKKGVCPKKYSHETKYFIVVVAFCWRCLVPYFVLFLFLFFFGGGGWGEKGVLCFVSVLVSFLFFSVFRFFLQECLNHLISVEGKPSPDPKLRFEPGDLERKRF